MGASYNPTTRSVIMLRSALAVTTVLSWICSLCGGFWIYFFNSSTWFQNIICKILKIHQFIFVSRCDLLDKNCVLRFGVFVLIAKKCLKVFRILIEHDNACFKVIDCKVDIGIVVLTFTHAFSVDFKFFKNWKRSETTKKTKTNLGNPNSFFVNFLLWNFNWILNVIKIGKFRLNVWWLPMQSTETWKWTAGIIVNASMFNQQKYKTSIVNCKFKSNRTNWQRR